MAHANSPESLNQITNDGLENVENENEFPLVVERVSSPVRVRTPLIKRFQRHICNPRIVSKTGIVSHVEKKNLSERYLRYMKDIVTTLINSRWRCILVIFSLSYFINWLFFGALYTLAAEAHGDLGDQEFTNVTIERPCISGTKHFTGFFLLAVETETTIGYGTRSIEEYCPEVVFLLCMQMLFGIGVHGAMVGIVYAKMVKPLRRSLTRHFSRNAVICHRDHKLCLMFRLSDLNHTRLIGTKLEAYLVDNMVTMEGEKLQLFHRRLRLETLGFLFWPLEAVHIIDETSPFYDVSAKDLLLKRFEIIVTLTGSSETTAQLSQIKTSYLNTEILWGYRFEPCVEYDETREKYVVDYSKLHDTVEVSTPLCSVKRLREVLGDVVDWTQLGDAGVSYV